MVDGPRPVGARKITGLVTLRDGVDADAARTSWLADHAPNVAGGFQAAGGLRYVVNFADQNRDVPPFLGVAELWYRDSAASKTHLSALAWDPFMDLILAQLLPGTEIIGIP